MGLLGPKVELQLNSNGPFQPGDVVEGTVIVENGAEFETQNLDVMLRCTEHAHTHYYDNYGLQTRRREVFNFSRLYSYRKTLFPTHDEQNEGPEPAVFWGTGTVKARNRWNKRFTKRYKLPGGSHAFEFSLKIPFNFPSTLFVSRSNCILWTVRVKLFKGGVFSAARETERTIEVFHGGTIGVFQALRAESSLDYKVKVYLDGYQQATKSASGFFKNIGSSEFKKYANVSLTLSFPRHGLLQAPHGANLGLQLSCPSLDQLIIKQVIVRLKRVVVTYIRPVQRITSFNIQRQAFSDSFRTESVIYSRTLQASCKQGIEEVNADLEALQIPGVHTNTMRSKHFEVSYQLAFEISIASREKPSSTDKLRASVPICVQSPMAAVAYFDSESFEPESTIFTFPDSYANGYMGDSEAAFLPAYENPPSLDARSSPSPGDIKT